MGSGRPGLRSSRHSAMAVGAGEHQVQAPAGSALLGQHSRICRPSAASSPAGLALHVLGASSRMPASSSTIRMCFGGRALGGDSPVVWPGCGMRRGGPYVSELVWRRGRHSRIPKGLARKYHRYVRSLQCVPELHEDLRMKTRSLSPLRRWHWAWRTAASAQERATSPALAASAPHPKRRWAADHRERQPGGGHRPLPQQSVAPVAKPCAARWCACWPTGSMSAPGTDMQRPTHGPHWACAAVGLRPADGGNTNTRVIFTTAERQDLSRQPDACRAEQMLVRRYVGIPLFGKTQVWRRPAAEHGGAP